MSSEISVVNTTALQATDTGANGVPLEQTGGDESFASVLGGHLEPNVETPTLLARMNGEHREGQSTEPVQVAAPQAVASLRARFLPDPQRTHIELGEAMLSNDDQIDPEWLTSEGTFPADTTRHAKLTLPLEQPDARAEKQTDTAIAAPLSTVAFQSESIHALDRQARESNGQSKTPLPLLSAARPGLATPEDIGSYADSDNGRAKVATAPGIVFDGVELTAADDAQITSKTLERTVAYNAPENQPMRELSVPVQTTRAEVPSTSTPLVLGTTMPGVSSAAASGLPAAVGAPYSLTLEETVGSDAWQDSLSNRVTWLNGQAVKRAVIQLRPADLGPISVEVSVKDDQASVNFAAQHAATREAIESALPRLREMLGANGLDLGHVAVADGGGLAQDNGAREQGGRDAAPQPLLSGTGEDANSGQVSEDRPASVTNLEFTGRGLFDAFV